MSEEVIQEVVVEQPIVEEVKVNPLAEQFQRIAKQEKFVASERQKIEESKKSFEADKALAESYKQLKGKNPFEILEHFGITYDKLLEADKARNNPIDPLVKRALDEVNQLKDQLSKKDKEALDSRMQKAEIQLKADIDMEIKNSEYDLIEKLDAKDAVKEYMEEMYDTTGEIPSIKEACEAITNHLIQQYSSIKDSKWLKPKEVEAQPETIASKSDSISNKMVQTAEHSNKPLSEADRMKAAIAVMAASSKK